ncbi:MAG TPA: hypothetical protein VGP93_21110, partial [Polyangiaceae bacterium]|nr:hypothetical protein [Polyangiaceae bacterium]
MPRVEFTSFALALAALGCAGNQGDGRNDSASAGGAAGSTATGGSGGPSGSGGAIPSAGSGGLASSSGGGGASAGSGNGGSAALGGTSSGGKGGALGAGAGPAIIFDTDMGPDIDDAGALAVLHALADNGEAKLLAVMIST